MIISIVIPNFWIEVEEQRRPELKGQPVIVGNHFLDRSSGQAKVLMRNSIAAEFGIQTGISMAHARQLCPEVTILPADGPLYAGVWSETMAILFGYTPLVQSVAPGEAVSDVSGCERLFGDPVSIAGDICFQLQAVMGLCAFAGVGSNRLVAQLAAQTLAAQSNHPDVRQRTSYIPPGREAAFIAPYPVTALPEIDPQTLLLFQVLGLKTIEHLRQIPAKALAARFPAGARLATYARGRDERPICPTPKIPAITVQRRPDHDLFEGLDIDALLHRLIETLAADLSAALREQGQTGRIIRLIVRSSRPTYSLSATTHRPRLTLVRPEQQEIGPTVPVPEEQLFPNQDARIHSMLPQPKQPGRNRYLDPMAGSAISLSSSSTSTCTDESSRDDDADPLTVIRAVARYETRRPVNDLRTLLELTQILFQKVLRDPALPELRWLNEPGIELHLEMSQFAPPEQMSLPGLDDRHRDSRRSRLLRQERVLSTRFGSTPFRHVEGVHPDSLLSEKSFRWSEGMAP